MKLKLIVLCCLLKSIAGGKLAGYGIGYPPLSSRIVGGTDAQDGFAPYQCSLQTNGQHFCGCAIISSQWILSAAHCLQSRPGDVEVLVGTNDLNSGGTRYQAQQFITNEGYDQPSFANDIGLLRVDGSIEFNEKVQPIKYSNKFVEGGATLQTTGWGRLSANGPIPQKLQILYVNAVTNEECESYHGSIVHESHLCTLTKEGEGVCSGDSGGPLVLDGELVGLTNWAVLCARGYPDGFARISYLYDWIQQHIDE